MHIKSFVRSKVKNEYSHSCHTFVRSACSFFFLLFRTMKPPDVTKKIYEWLFSHRAPRLTSSGSAAAAKNNQYHYEATATLLLLLHSKKHMHGRYLELNKQRTRFQHTCGGVGVGTGPLPAAPLVGWGATGTVPQAGHDPPQSTP
eukprot:SAG11_NODE_808_length_7088_cov_5.136357_8_plen_145_part_00